MTAHPTPGRRWARRGLALAVVAGLAGAAVWLRLADHPGARALLRLYSDREHLRTWLTAWGVWAPVFFIAIQAAQVLVAPIPGEVTGLLGGFVFGPWWGFAYSMIGLTAGTLGAFGVGRWLGSATVRRLVSPDVWRRLGFVVETEGAILCFALYLIPGLPKDMLCYLFGLSPMPFWVFTVTSTLGRAPGTWLLSAQGANVARGHYVEFALLAAGVAAVAFPLYYWRDWLVARLHGRPGEASPDGPTR
jgi:uncharacterized membrane protein YdjX (TVP38/TMEM64 family)